MISLKAQAEYAVPQSEISAVKLEYKVILGEDSYHFVGMAFILTTKLAYDIS